MLSEDAFFFLNTAVVGTFSKSHIFFPCWWKIVVGNKTRSENSDLKRNLVKERFVCFSLAQDKVASFLNQGSVLVD